MNKVAIVGTSKIRTREEENDIRDSITVILKKYSALNTKVISGGAEGVDSIAVNIAEMHGFDTQVFLPKIKKWEPPTKDGYKSRNIQIANECNELFCIALPYRLTKCYHHSDNEKIREHENTAGCFTLNIAKTQNKPVELIVIPKR